MKYTIFVMRSIFIHEVMKKCASLKGIWSVSYDPIESVVHVQQFYT